jgi:hypothetical protein
MGFTMAKPLKDFRFQTADFRRQIFVVSYQLLGQVVFMTIIPKGFRLLFLRFLILITLAL